MVEYSNSTYYSKSENTALLGDNTYLYVVGAVIVIAISILILVVFQMKKACATNEENLQRIEEIKVRKSCPKRRKRAIYKLIETETLTQEEENEEKTTKQRRNPNNEKSGEEKFECPICLEPFEKGQDLSRSQRRKCYHTFHAECLEPWLMKHDDCPCCRAIFIEESTLLEDDDSAVSSNESVNTASGSDENV